MCVCAENTFSQTRQKKVDKKREEENACETIHNNQHWHVKYRINKYTECVVSRSFYHCRRKFALEKLWQVKRVARALANSDAHEAQMKVIVERKWFFEWNGRRCVDALRRTEPPTEKKAMKQKKKNERANGEKSAARETGEWKKQRLWLR